MSEWIGRPLTDYIQEVVVNSIGIPKIIENNPYSELGLEIVVEKINLSKNIGDDYIFKMGASYQNKSLRFLVEPKSPQFIEEETIYFFKIGYINPKFDYTFSSELFKRSSKPEPLSQDAQRILSLFTKGE